MVITAHGSDVPGYNPEHFGLAHRVMAPFWHRTLTRAAALVTPSQSLANLVRKRRPTQNIIVIPNGIEGMPAGINPAPVLDFKKLDDPDDELSHLIAIAMTKEGHPFRLFAVNRWVTGEVWYTAGDVTSLLDCFKIDHARPSWPVNRWVTGMVALFRPQIVALLVARDRAVAGWSEAHPDVDVYEDRELEITAYLDISVEDQVRSVARSLMQRK